MSIPTNLWIYFLLFVKREGNREDEIITPNHCRCAFEFPIYPPVSTKETWLSLYSKLEFPVRQMSPCIME